MSYSRFHRPDCSLLITLLIWLSTITVQVYLISCCHSSELHLTHIKSHWSRTSKHSRYSLSGARFVTIHASMLRSLVAIPVGGRWETNKHSNKWAHPACGAVLSRFCFGKLFSIPRDSVRLCNPVTKVLSYSRSLDGRNLSHFLGRQKRETA